MQYNNKALAESITSIAKEHHQDIIAYLNNHELQDICYAYKSRVKTKSGILEKFERKKVDKQGYTVENITDIIGIRFIVLFKQDIIPAIESIVGMLGKDSNDKNPFNGCTINELIYYKGNIWNSNISNKVDESFSSINGKIVEENSLEGYSSIHIVCTLDTDESDLIPKSYRIPVEIQVRTIFEDAWGEIDHKYGYRDRRDKNTPHPMLNKHLKTLKQFVDACVDYADLIVEESKFELNPNDYSKVLNVPESPTNNGIFSELDIDENFITKYNSAIKSKNEVIDGEKTGENNSTKLLECSGHFMDIRNQYLDNKGTSDYDIFTFYCDVNYAFCNLASNTQDGIKEAKYIYTRLKNIDPDNSLLLMRLGQAMVKTGSFDKGISLLEESFDSALRNRSKFKLKDTDIKYILSKALKIAGYSIWLKIDSSTKPIDEASKSSMYQKAYELTSKGLEHVDKDSEKKEYIDYQNNIIFYLTEVCKTNRSKNTFNLISSRLKLIEDEYNSEEDIDATILHTLLNSYYLFEDTVKCRLYSRLLKSKIFEKSYEFDDSEALDMLKFIDKVNNSVTDE